MIYTERSLNNLFDEFYREVVVCRKLAIEAKDRNSDIVCDQIFNRLNIFLQGTTSAYIQDQGDFIMSSLQEVTYLMAALADEAMLNFNWTGQNQWSNNLLENKFFGTHKAGEEVFNRIDSFLTNRNPLLTEIAEIYLKTLALGFKGKYKRHNQGMIISYRKKLYRFITQNDIDSNSNKIFLQGYNFTLSNLPAQYFPNHNTWDYVFYSFIVVFVIGTSIFWEVEVASINSLLTSINKALGQ